MKKNKVSKFIAFIALFWIIIWIVWTWILILFSPQVSNAPDLNEINLSDYIKSTWSQDLSWEEALPDLSWSIVFPEEPLNQDLIMTWSENTENN